MPAIYRCPSEASNENVARHTTSYVAVIGARTAWPGAAARSPGEILDGTAGTLQLVEASELNIPWLAPRDPSLEEWTALVAASDVWPRGHVTWDTWTMWSKGRHVAECDGYQEFVGHHLSTEDWIRLWQIDDGAPFLHEEYYWPRGEARHRFRAGAAGRALAMLTFFVLTLLPTCWLRKVSRRASDVAPPQSESG